MRVVMALGGNALLRRGEPPDLETQHRNMERAIDTVAPIVRRHEVVITHGNGPQIGLLALQAAAYQRGSPMPLDLLGAESDGMIGYLLELALANALPDRSIASLLTLVEVNSVDPAFLTPTKPIGPIYSDSEATRLREETPWTMIRDGDGWRRGVASPAPIRIRDIEIIEVLLRAGVIVVCAGGGGIPIIGTESNGFKGVEAVIDKDLTASLLAQSIGADALLILTDVPAVWTSWPMSEDTPIRRTTPRELRAYQFASGSMGPKVEAACQFVETTGRTACIGAIDDAEAVLAGTAGTIVRQG